MFPVGGVSVMLLGAALTFVACAGLGVLLRKYVDLPTAIALAGFVWWVSVIGFVTLIPANGAPGIVSAENRLNHCSTDYGGPAPDGFWILASGQRLLNLLLFVPAGLSLALAAATRGRWVRVLVAPVGLVLLASYSVAIELTQLHLARLDRACDVTDMVDNGTGAAIGLALGVAGTVLVTLRRRSATSQRTTRRLDA